MKEPSTAKKNFIWRDLESSDPGLGEGIRKSQGPRAWRSVQISCHEPQQEEEEEEELAKYRLCFLGLLVSRKTDPVDCG